MYSRLPVASRKAEPLDETSMSDEGAIISAGMSPTASPDHQKGSSFPAIAESGEEDESTNPWIMARSRYSSDPQNTQRPLRPCVGFQMTRSLKGSDGQPWTRIHLGQIVNSFDAGRLYFPNGA